MFYLALLSVLVALASASDVAVQTKNGKLLGVRSEYFGDEYVDVYKGIPYALPPTGNTHHYTFLENIHSFNYIHSL